MKKRRKHDAGFKARVALEAARRGLLQRNRKRSAGEGCSSNHPDTRSRIKEKLKLRERCQERSAEGPVRLTYDHVFNCIDYGHLHESSVNRVRYEVVRARNYGNFSRQCRRWHVASSGVR
jgi:hypothetical protein